MNPIKAHADVKRTRVALPLDKQMDDSMVTTPSEAEREKCVNNYDIMMNIANIKSKDLISTKNVCIFAEPSQAGAQLQIEEYVVDVLQLRNSVAWNRIKTGFSPVSANNNDRIIQQRDCRWLFFEVHKI